MDFNESIFTNPNYKHYIAAYNEKELKKAKPSKDYFITTINKQYAIVSCETKFTYQDILEKTRGILRYIARSNLYVLESIQPIDASGVSNIQSFEGLKLSGRGVLVGLIDTGMNYLNKEFIDSSGSSRINCIWDQSIISDKKIIYDDIRVPFGSIYTNEEINNAIRVSKDGKNPYEFVPSADYIGHGTKMAGVIGAKGENFNIKGIARECEYVVVKMIEAEDYKKQYGVDINLYNVTSILAAIEFVVEISLKLNKPVVIYLPIGSNFGNHQGQSLIENYISDISINRGVAVVTGTGNEGDVDKHASGILNYPGDIRNVDFYVDSKQKNLSMQIWIGEPNIMSLNVIAPSGEETGIIPAFYKNIQENRKFIFEKTLVEVRYFIPEESSGDELITLYFSNIKEGLWTVRLVGEYIVDGRFDAWLPSKGVAIGETEFIKADPYGTLTTPGSSPDIINVACYDQTKDYIVDSSGKDFEYTKIEGIDIAAGGVNVKTTNIDGDGYSIVNGSSVSAAVVAGACALIMEWGIVKGRDTKMYSLKIKSYLIRGTKKRVGDIYPNPELGYGILDMVEVFRYMT